MDNETEGLVTPHWPLKTMQISVFSGFARVGLFLQAFFAADPQKACVVQVEEGLAAGNSWQLCSIG